MATHDVDQKTLGRLANSTADSNPLLSSALFRILGLSILLSRRLYRARKLRKLDPTRDTKSLALYHHIIWLSREGLALLEIFVLPYSEQGQYGNELRILGAKLRASFYHVFCLFHNQPPISQLIINSPLLVSPQTGPLSPATANDRKPPQNLPATGQGTSRSPRPTDTEGLRPTPAQERKAALRDAIPSMVSEASYITNPFAQSPNDPNASATTAAAGVGDTASSLVPGLSPPPPGALTSSTPILIPTPSAFLLPLANFLPQTTSYFATAAALAAQFLPGSNPLRLSVALEHAAFTWDCLADHAGARRLAKRAIADVYRAQEGMDDREFADAAALVGTLGRMMKRGSIEGTPQFPNSPVATGKSTGLAATLREALASPPSDRSPETRKPPNRDLPPQPSLRGGDAAAYHRHVRGSNSVSGSEISRIRAIDSQSRPAHHARRYTTSTRTATDLYAVSSR